MKIKLKNVGIVSFGLVAALVLSPSNVGASEADSTLKAKALGVELGISSVVDAEISDLTIDDKLEGATEAIGALEELSSNLKEQATSELETIRTQADDAMAQLESTLTEPVIEEVLVGVFDTEVTASEDGIEVDASSAVTTEVSEDVQAYGEANVNIASGLEGATEALGAVEELSSNLKEQATSELETIRTQADDAMAQLESTLTEPVIDEVRVGVIDTEVTASEDGIEVDASSAVTTEVSEDVQANGEVNVNIASGLEGATEALGVVEELSSNLKEQATSELETIRTQADDAIDQLESTLTEPVIEEVRVGVFDTEVTASEDGIEVDASSAVTTEVSEVVQANGEANVNIASGLEGATEAIGVVEELSSNLKEQATSEVETIRTQADDAIAQL